jgi:hypothetical protein
MTYYYHGHEDYPDYHRHKQICWLRRIARHVQDAPVYIIEHEGPETRLPGIEMVCLACGEQIRSQDEVELVEK